MHIYIYSMAKKFKFPLKFISQESSAFLVATHIVGGVLAGLLVGYVVDSLFNSSPWGLLIFFLLGIIAGFKNAYQEMNRLVEKENKTTLKTTAQSSSDESLSKIEQKKDS